MLKRTLITREKTLKLWLRTKLGLKLGIIWACCSIRRLHQSTGSCLRLWPHDGSRTHAVNQPCADSKTSCDIHKSCDTFTRTWPFSITMILLQLITVLRRWAMIRVVQLPNTLWMVSWMRRSVSVSMAAVASSRIRIWKHNSDDTINTSLFVSLFCIWQREVTQHLPTHGAETPSRLQSVSRSPHNARSSNACR